MRHYRTVEIIIATLKSLTHSFGKYSLCNCYVPGTVLGATGNTAMDKTKPNNTTVLRELTLQ